MSDKPRKHLRVASLTRNDMAYIFTVRKRSCEKVMFLHLSVILFTGGRGVHPPWQTQPPGRHTPSPTPRQTPPTWTDTYPPGRHPPRQTPPRQTTPQQTPPWQTYPLPLRQPLQWTVRILLECILVLLYFCF